MAARKTARKSARKPEKNAPNEQLDRLASLARDHVRKLSAFIYIHEHGLDVTTADYSDLPIIEERLNEKEKELFNQNPVIGAKVLLHALSATNNSENLYEQNQLRNGNGDAYRHMYWNFRMGKDTGVGQTWAEKWGNAHEYGSTAPLETAMDLHNNMRGRELAAANVDDDPRALRSAVRNGSCRIIRGGALVRSTNEGEKA